MFGYELTIIVIAVSAISVKITRWIYFIVKEVDSCQFALLQDLVEKALLPKVDSYKINCN